MARIMSAPHFIRLRGPWRFQPVYRSVREVEGSYRQQTDDLPQGGKTEIPCDWGRELGHDFHGCVRYTRHFHCPTNLQPRDRVWLALGGVDHQAVVTLNGQPVGSLSGYDRTQRFDITDLLEASNLLVVDVTLDETVYRDPQARPGRAGAPGGLVGEVRLEIAST